MICSTHVQTASELKSTKKVSTLIKRGHQLFFAAKVVTGNGGDTGRNGKTSPQRLFSAVSLVFEEIVSR